MTTTDAITELTERVKRLEQAVFVRQSTFELQTNSTSAPQHDSIAERRRIFQTLRERQGITNKPIGAEALQKMLEQEHLDSNEMSHSVREMREE